jgi:hypothetical protein
MMSASNLFAWMLQTVIIAVIAALLPILFRVRHPRLQLHYCHAALVLCFLLPVVEPWRRQSAIRSTAAFPGQGLWLFALLAAGIVLQLCWMWNGLWRIRRYRIGATPLYPIPEAMQAASAITHADALFCISDEAAGPMMLGWLAPVVLLPAAFLTLNEEAQCGIACHELLHVRRGDWLVTLIEEFARALLWFNPGAWLLLSEARLAREQLVDEESVRLTASREPYIDALLAIARGRAWSDLVPAPSFLRRSHLTQRMQSLLSDTPASMRRVSASYCSIAAILACSVWLASTLFPLLALSGEAKAQTTVAASVARLAVVSSASSSPAPPSSPAERKPVPRVQALPTSPLIDPYEPVTGGVRLASTPAERTAAVSLLARASQASLRHAPGTPPWRFTVSFVAGGKVLDTGQGELTETWMTGQKWRWTASLGAFSHTRLAFGGQLLEDHHAAVIPMRAHMLRFEVLWAIHRLPSDGRIRTAKISWHGRPATCILTSEGPADDEELQLQWRLWSEEEYCFDDAADFLVVHSVAPGTYAQFDYDGPPGFHGWPMPARIKTYVAGELASDATVSVTDATTADEASLTPAPGMTGTPTPIGLGNYFRIRISSPGAPDANSSQPVIVHAEIDGDGNVVETELSATSNPAIVPAALEVVRKTHFGHTGTERQAYIDFRFVPQSQ